MRQIEKGKRSWRKRKEGRGARAVWSCGSVGDGEGSDGWRGLVAMSVLDRERAPLTRAPVKIEQGGRGGSHG